MVRTSLCSFGGQLLEVHAHDQLAHGLGAHAGAEQPRRRRARPMPYLRSRSRKFQPSSDDLGQQHARLQAVDLVLGLADLLLEALGLALEALPLGLERGVDLQAQVLDAAA